MWRTSSRISSVETWRCRMSASRIWLPIVWTGESDDIGSWKIMPMRPPRRARISGPSRRRLREVDRRAGVLGIGEQDAAAENEAVLGQEAHHGLGDHGLAGAGFAHQRHGLAGRDTERDALDDFGGTALHGEADPQVFDPEDVRSRGFGRGRRNGTLLEPCGGGWPALQTRSERNMTLTRIPPRSVPPFGPAWRGANHDVRFGAGLLADQPTGSSGRQTAVVPGRAGPSLASLRFSAAAAMA